MNEHGTSAGEFVGYRRVAAVPGIEVLDVYDSAREWRCVHESFAVGFLQTWRGGMTYRGETYDMAPGKMVYTQPGEALVATPLVGHVGSFHVIELAPSLLEDYIESHQARPTRPEWRDGPNTMSEPLARKLRQLLVTLTPEALPLAPQSAAVELSRVLVSELMCGTVARPPGPGVRAFRAAARMREFLQRADFQVSLDALAATAGLSKFQALRAFRRRYGLTPHAYQMCVRVKRVTQLLLSGSSLAEAAAECGFADQSHMNRHFKRILRVTPRQYLCARGKLGAPRFDVDRADRERH
ncbi:MAG TPA: AraC family transcriptional regulator [Polyangiaceae bacterium]|jgi:AraC-like DNA-binding protein